MNETISVPAPIRDITRLIAELESGDFHHEVSKALTELLADLEQVRMDQHGKPSGTLALSFNFTNDDGVIEIKSKFKVTPPEKKRPKTIFWITSDNHLSRQNPRQMDMGFRDVSGSRRAVVDV